jgi:hypothetical protein
MDQRVPKFSFMSIVTIVLGLALAGAVAALLAARAYGDVAVGYAAKQMCSCLYVANRFEDECLAELGEARDVVQLVYFNERVVANFSGLVQAQARLRPGFGCSVSDYVGAMPHAGQ